MDDVVRAVDRVAEPLRHLAHHVGGHGDEDQRGGLRERAHVARGGEPVPGDPRRSCVQRSTSLARAALAQAQGDAPGAAAEHADRPAHRPPSARGW